MSLPIVCIVGRPNVGKSTLFNRILQRRLAVVDPTPGVTRDRHYATAEWANRHFVLIDTGGLVMNSGVQVQQEITAQAELAIAESDLVLFVLDGLTPPHSDDQTIMRQLLRSGKPAVVAVNKIDSEPRDLNIYDFTRLGPIEPFGISALSGRAVGDLLELIVARLPSVDPDGEDRAESEAPPIHLAIVGRPNVGKSSLVNQLVGEARMIVSPSPGTTRDAIDTSLDFEGQPFVLIDTAGLRKKARVQDQLEFYTALRSIRAIQRADVVCVLLDAAQELGVQDFKIAEAAVEAGAGLFFGVNKWDLIEKDTATAGAYAIDLRDRALTFAWAPVLFLSALTGQRAGRALAMAQTIAAERRKRIPTPLINDTVLADIGAKPPPAIQGRFIQINYITQSPETPPTFVAFCNHPELIAEPYQRFVTNRLRERFGFVGVPIRLRFRKKGKRG
ncbi:MAG: ribosome biogenesis GTPase Der [candidate division Zixibacteria bacterium]|nr:ribosome biogenesis GTPase Der [candidate division Zixibacteria bacterium]